MKTLMPLQTYSEDELQQRTVVDEFSLIDCELAAKQMVMDWKWLVKQTNQYPLELCFTKNRYVLTSEDGLRDMLEVLLQKIAQQKFLEIITREMWLVIQAHEKSDV